MKLNKINGVWNSANLLFKWRFGLLSSSNNILLSWQRDVTTSPPYFKYMHTLGSALKLFMPRGKFSSANQNDKPDLLSDTSSVWNFCICSSDVILQGNSYWHRQNNVSCLFRQTPPLNFLCFLCPWKCKWLQCLWGEGGTPYNGLHGEAPHKRGYLFCQK